MYADVSDVLERHGPGVYMVQVWVPVKEEPAGVSVYSVFYEIDSLEEYD